MENFIINTFFFITSRGCLVITGLILIVILLFTSCMSVKTNVGRFKELPGKEYKYSKSKQVWLFYGTVPFGKTDISTPSDGQCKIIVCKNGFDLIISGITGGFIKCQTIKVIAKK